MVTLTPSSRKTRSSGSGRKSRTILNRPRASLVYLILALIDCLPSSPKAGTKDSDDAAAEREANRQDAALDSPEAVVPHLAGAVGQILRDHPLRSSVHEVSESRFDVVNGSRSNAGPGVRVRKQTVEERAMTFAVGRSSATGICTPERSCILPSF